MNLRYYLLGFLFFFSANILFAQQSSGEDEFTEKGALPVLNSQSLQFFSGEDGNTYYIDFETINVALQELVLRNEQGEILLRDDLSSLPVNTIYELNLSAYGSGSYEVELRAFNGIMRKDLLVR